MIGLLSVAQWSLVRSSYQHALTHFFVSSYQLVSYIRFNVDNQQSLQVLGPPSVGCPSDRLPFSPALDDNADGGGGGMYIPSGFSGLRDFHAFPCDNEILNTHTHYGTAAHPPHTLSTYPIISKRRVDSFLPCRSVYHFQLDSSE